MGLSVRRRRWTRRLAGVAVLAVLASVGVQASAAQSAPPPTPANLQAWHVKIAKVEHPSARGCFTAEYPEMKWTKSTCVSAPSIPMTPKSGPTPLTIGNGNSISAQAPSGTISEAFGSFENITNVTSVSSSIGGGPPVSNAYTLQLNTDFFATPACASSPNPLLCRGWEQFIFANNGSTGVVYLQYWLVQYNAACPAGWTQLTVGPDTHCYQNSPSATGVPQQPITNLGSLNLSGQATSGGDSATLLVGTTAYSVAGPNIVDAHAGWTMAEFNVFGYGDGSEATFNNGASMHVRTRINYGGTLPPICVAYGFTAETNNLNFGTPTPPATPPGPALIFLENTTGGATTTCSAASTIGDTHQRTFAGLFYDFQASGDFVEAQVGSGFEVQTRKVSAAPTWPNASVNRSVATRMGSTRVALCNVENLVVNGKRTEVPSNGSLHLPSGVDIHRIGNTYIVTDQAGNSLRTTFHSLYTNVDVGLGTWPTTVRGLLGNPDNDPTRLEARDGTQFRVPVPFNDLYQRYGASWRVSPMQSLLAPCDAVAVGNPSRPFFADDLDEDIRVWAETTCRRAEIRQVWLGACTLDVAVLGERAVETFINLEPPVVDGNPKGNR